MSYWERQLPRRSTWGLGSSYEDEHDTGRHQGPSYKPTGEEGKYDRAMETYTRNSLDSTPVGSPRNKAEASIVVGSVPRKDIDGKLMMQKVTWGNPDKFPAEPDRPLGAIGRAAAERRAEKEDEKHRQAALYVNAFSERYAFGVMGSYDALRMAGIDVHDDTEAYNREDTSQVERARHALGSIADAIESSGATPEAVEMFVVGVAGHLAESFPALTQAMQAAVEVETT